MKKVNFLIILFLLLFMQLYGFDIQAHRGGRDLYPENTMAAFRNAIELGVTTLELDLAMTKDGVIVISHDPYLSYKLVKNNRDSFISKYRDIYIKDLTFSKVREYSVGSINPASSYYAAHTSQTAVPGEKIPSLEELFAYTDEIGEDDIRFNIEIKTYPENPEYTQSRSNFVNAVLSVVQKYDKASRITIQSFDWSSLALVKEQNRGISIVCLAAKKLKLNGKTFNLRLGDRGPSPWLDGLDADDFASTSELVQEFGADVISPYYRDISLSDIQKAHELGLKIIPWTINDPGKMLQFIEMGVDGIITDRPDLLIALLSESN